MEEDRLFRLLLLRLLEPLLSGVIQQYISGASMVHVQAIR